ncbi:MAG: hypothetical protein LQ351_008147 [Letrouitia transgressa]|nr:MAG: hypothetical protein LQ351_008147 [Letrouitia transgressa]
MRDPHPSHTLPALPPPFDQSSSPPILLTLGAEAHLYTTHFLTPSCKAVLKYRPSKAYRHPILDVRLTRQRILAEARILVKCRREGLNVPGVLALDVAELGKGRGTGGWMMMEWINGGTIRERLQRGKAWSEKTTVEMENIQLEDPGRYVKLHAYLGRYKEQKTELMEKIGRAIGRMHEIGVVHGDLTTSNLMLKPNRTLGDPEGVVNGDFPLAGSDGSEISLEGVVVVIDFGLAGQSVQDEDKAVDLYVLERAFGSTHPEAEEDFKEVLRAYDRSYKGAKVVLKRLEDVRMRGRKRSMVG